MTETWTNLFDRGAKYDADLEAIREDLGIIRSENDA